MFWPIGNRINAVPLYIEKLTEHYLSLHIQIVLKTSLMDIVSKQQQEWVASICVCIFFNGCRACWSLHLHVRPGNPPMIFCVFKQWDLSPEISNTQVLCSDWFSWIQKSRRFQSKAKTYPPNPELSGFMTPTHNILPIAASTAEPPFLIKSNPTSAHSFTSDTTAAWPIEKIKW